LLKIESIVEDRTSSKFSTSCHPEVEILELFEESRNYGFGTMQMKFEHIFTCVAVFSLEVND